MKALISEARLLFGLIAVDRPVRVTATALGITVLCVVGVYAATSDQAIGLYADAVGQSISQIAARIHDAIGLSRDRSPGEIFNYGLAFVAATLFFLTFIENRSLMLFFLSALMAFVWFDDAMQYHERFGDVLAEQIGLPALPGLRQVDTGEMIAWAVAGLLLGSLLLLSLMRRRDGDLGPLALVSLGFGVLVFCGIFADMVHIAAPPQFGLFLEVIEDGGEMLAMTYMCWIALGFSRNGKMYYDAVAKGAVQYR